MFVLLPKQSLFAEEKFPQRPLTADHLYQRINNSICPSVHLSSLPLFQLFRSTSALALLSTGLLKQIDVDCDDVDSRR